MILDFDGTLAPIVRRPAAARLDPKVRGTLRRLAAQSRIGLAILSGRSLPDIKRQVGLTRVIYGGCHGLEIEGPGLQFRKSLAPSLHARLGRARVALEEMITRFPGAELEWKGLAVAIHYRRMTSSRLEPLFSLTKEVAAREGLAIIPGKKVLDLVPPGRWRKSNAVSLIEDYVKKRFDGRPSLTVYAGDDTTDAEAFPFLHERGIAIQVGGRRGAADYWLRGPREVHGMLRSLAGPMSVADLTTSGGRGSKGSPSSDA